MKLYIVPTPIGNLEDITLRALNVLRSVDLILCEDTRTTRKLLQHFEIDKRCMAYHIFNEHEQMNRFLGEIKAHEQVALVSDAGTPGISDPGFLPHKKGKETLLKRVAEMEETVIFYESPHRLLKSLEKMVEIMGPDRRISVSKEISKIYAHTFRGTLAEAVAHFSQGEVKGEFVIILEGKVDK